MASSRRRSLYAAQTRSRSLDRRIDPHDVCCRPVAKGQDLRPVGQLGSGLLYLAAKLGDWGQTSVTMALGDYGTKFLVVAGLLNIVSAIDAHSLANGRKAS